MEEEKVAYESISLWLPLPYRVLLLFIIGPLLLLLPFRHLRDPEPARRDA